VSLFIPHQANLRIIEAACKRVSLPMERVFVNVDRYGNTGAASVYVALEEALAAGRIKRGDLVLLAAFGGGFACGAGLMRRQRPGPPPPPRARERRRPVLGARPRRPPRRRGGSATSPPPRWAWTYAA